MRLVVSPEKLHGWRCRGLRGERLGSRRCLSIAEEISDANNCCVISSAWKTSAGYAAGVCDEEGWSSSVLMPLPAVGYVWMGPSWARGPQLASQREPGSLPSNVIAPLLAGDHRCGLHNIHSSTIFTWRFFAKRCDAGGSLLLLLFLFISGHVIVGNQ